eukprot:jgi/Bigna1/143668/aug1.80_g18376
MGACCSNADPYPCPLPEACSAQYGYPDSIEILRPEDKPSVDQAVALCARSFAGGEAAPPPGEFDWLLYDGKTNAKIEDADERVHRLNAVMGWSVHKAFKLKSHGLVLTQRSGLFKNSQGSDLESDEKRKKNKIVGCCIMYIYPERWTPSPDGFMMAMKIAMAAGASEWTAKQNDTIHSDRLKALDKAMVDMKKRYLLANGANGAHVCLQILATDPTCQGQGVGSKLMKAVCAIGDGLKLPVYLECDAGKNDRFYRKFGFEELGSTPLEVKGGEAFSGKFMAMKRPAQTSTMTR